MGSRSRAEYRARLGYWSSGSSLNALDADHIRVHLCANAQYAIDDINRAIADALEAGELVKKVERGKYRMVHL